MLEGGYSVFPKGINTIQTFRDLTLMPLTDGSLLVIACDSLGSIGPKPTDVVQVPGYVVGRLTARVALMEVLATGATPQILVNTLAVEMTPTGRDIVRGIREEIREGGLSLPVLTGSSEENVTTVQTGVGITVIGALPDSSHFRCRPAAPGNVIVCVGRPKVGKEVSLADPEISDIPLLRRLLQLEYITDILPVGSRGIAYEARLMAETAGLTWEEGFFNPNDSPNPDSSPDPHGPPNPKASSAPETSLDPEINSGPGIDLFKSAGPATCVLAALPPDKIPHMRKYINKPITVIGRLRTKQSE